MGRRLFTMGPVHWSSNWQTLVGPLLFFGDLERVVLVGQERKACFDKLLGRRERCGSLSKFWIRSCGVLKSCVLFIAVRWLVLGLQS